MQENFISSSSSVKTRLKILHFYRFFRRNGSSPEICFNDGRCVSPAWISDLLGDFHKNQEKVLKFLVEIVTKLQVIATERFLKEQKNGFIQMKEFIERLRFWTLDNELNKAFVTKLLRKSSLCHLQLILSTINALQS